MKIQSEFHFGENTCFCFGHEHITQLLKSHPYVRHIAISSAISFKNEKDFPNDSMSPFD